MKKLTTIISCSMLLIYGLLVGVNNRADPGATAYAVLYGAKYDIQKNNTKQKLIMEKLGIEMTSGDYSKGNGYNNRSFFSNSKPEEQTQSANGGMRQATLEEIG